jgi:Na+-translocating ferredoxin:NAD+ oxidoreductase RnfC subunit
VKAGSRVDFVIANGAECEPLIHKDYEIMVRHAADVVRGVELMMDATGASAGIIGIKEKNKSAIDAIAAVLRSDRIRIHLLGDFYPSGDEYILVYEATGRLIPPQGIPLDVGIVVNNVETLRNIARAAENLPVTEKFITVAGAVNHPVTFVAPVGMSYEDAIASAGGAIPESYAVFAGGLMMGKLTTDLNTPVTKTTAGLIVLPSDHTLVRRKGQPEVAMHRIGRSACDQCSYCTELCPRYVLGYDVQPHKVMRSLGFTSTGENIWNQFAQLCCACGLCTLYACPESLFPKEACDKSKHDLKEAGIAWSGKTEVVPHPMYEGRRTPLKQLVRRLGVTDYDHPSEFCADERSPHVVRIPVSQHIGTAAHPGVKQGDRVRKGDCLGTVPEGKLGANIHASIDGIVESVGDSIVIRSDS